MWLISYLRVVWWSLVSGKKTGNLRPEQNKRKKVSVMLKNKQVKCKSYQGGKKRKTRFKQ